MFFPIAEMLPVERGKFRRHPGFRVNAIGDTRDRHLADRHAGPNLLPERLAHRSMQAADAIRIPARPQRENGHAKSIDWIRACLAETKKFVEGDLQLGGEIAEITQHHLARKSVVAGRN